VSFILLAGGSRAIEERAASAYIRPASQREEEPNETTSDLRPGVGFGPGCPTSYHRSMTRRTCRGTSAKQPSIRFHRSGIEIELATGDRSSREASLLTSPGAPRKGNERETACRARRDIALEIVAVTPTTRKGTMLGMAEPLAWEGLNARVFDDHVRDAAERQNRDYAGVLAHATAHEIGHVLLRSSTHSQRGLMSAMWTDLEYDWMARGLMFFTSDQSKAMRAVLSGAGCPVAAEKRGGDWAS
jgi:hypothetical protein